MKSYQKSLDKNGKYHFKLMESIISLPSKIDAIKRAGDVMKLYNEAQRAVEADRATLSYAWYCMTQLRKSIQNTSKLVDSERNECLDLLDEKLLKRTQTMRPEEERRRPFAFEQVTERLSWLPRLHCIPKYMQDLRNCRCQTCLC
jgi:hypothetical protein